MIGLTRFNKDVSSFIVQCNNNGSGNTKEFTISLGKLLADKASIPTSPVEDIRSFLNTEKLEIYNILSRINETIIIDIENIVDIFESFYRTRYDLIYGYKRVSFRGEETAIIDFFGLNKHISMNTLETIKSCGVKIAYYYNELSKLKENLDELLAESSL